jgi:hypothetical protein
MPFHARVRCCNNLNIPELLLSNGDPVVHVHFLVDCSHSVSVDCASVFVTVDTFLQFHG